MSVLFLLEAAKRTDEAFHAAPSSKAHTISSYHADVVRMVQHLLEKNVTTEDEGRREPTFKDPTEKGWQKLSTTSWLQDRLSAFHQDEEEENVERGEVDLDYELLFVV